MNFTPRPLSKHRRARLIAWALALLLWMAQVMFAGAPFTARQERQRGPRMSLADLEGTVRQLIVSRAADFARVRWRARRNGAYRGRLITAPGGVAALIGARVRRMLKRRGIGERISILIHALTHLDTYASLVAKRVRRGLTRRWRVFVMQAPPRAVPLVSLDTPRPRFADSS